jgi:hypothetical protein
MTKTLVALVLIAGGILLATRLVNADKPEPARLSPPTGADQISEARRMSPTMSARDVCNLIDPWQKCSFSKPNIIVVAPRITTQAAALSLCEEFVRHPRYEKNRRADGARLDTAYPFEQGRADKLLSLLVHPTSRAREGCSWLSKVLMSFA